MRKYYYLNFSELELIMLFKATSWFFGPIISNSDKNENQINKTDCELILEGNKIKLY